MLQIAQFGAGRIGVIHAANLAASSKARLRYVVDVDVRAGAALAKKHGAEAADRAAVFADPAIDAVVIASSTDTHAELAIAAARAGKAIFCEKPIDLALDRVDACIEAVRRAGVPMFVAFNRRFDPSFVELRRRLRRGEIGAIEQIVITSRDPALPPMAFLETSGGMFRDMAIHDLDMVRWLLEEEPVEVFAYGTCLVEPALAQIGDIDTAMILLRTAGGRLAHVNNSRRAVYGYDQRIEVLGAKGRLMAGNRAPTSVELADGDAVKSDKPMGFFLERYAEAYRAELDAFLTALGAGTPMAVGPEDGRQALVLAEAVVASARSGRPVAVSAPRVLSDVEPAS